MTVLYINHIQGHIDNTTVLLKHRVELFSEFYGSNTALIKNI
jgi:hypothetical protein